MKLRELKTGDRFYPATGNKLPVYMVFDDPKINMDDGSLWRFCKIVHSGAIVSNECSMEVVKL